MWQFIQIVTNVNTKVKIFLNVFVTLISKCDTIFKMWQYFQIVTLFLKVWHYFQIVTLFSKCHTFFQNVTLFSKCHTFFQNVTLFSKCHTWCIFLKVWHLSQNFTFCHTFFTSFWLVLIGCHKLMSHFMSIFHWSFPEQTRGQ